MAKVTEYSRITKMKDNDILLVDGPDGTRTILQTDASKQMGGEVIMVNETAGDSTKVVINTTDEDIELATMADLEPVEEDVSELKTQLINLTGNTLYNFTPGYIATNGTNVNIETVTPHNEYVHSVIPCNAGDVFYVDAYGGSIPKSWCFIDNNDSGKVLDTSTQSSVSALITAPANSTHLIVNTNTNRNNGFVCKNKPIKDVVTDNEIEYKELYNKNKSNTDELRDSTGFVTGNKIIDFEPGYINTSESTVDTSTIIPHNDYFHAMAQCVEGDVFSINVYGGNIAKAWCFIDSSNNVLTVAGDSGYNTKTITAPPNAVMLILNSSTSARTGIRSACRGVTIDDRVKAIETVEGASYEELTVTSTDGKYVSANSGGTPNSNSNCYTNYIRVRQNSHIIAEKIAVTGLRCIAAYGKTQNFLRPIITNSSVTEYEFDVAKDVWYIRLTGVVGITPVVKQTKNNIQDTERFFDASNILIPYKYSFATERKIVTYIDDDALSEAGMDLLQIACDNISANKGVRMRCTIAAIAKILESTPSRVTYLKAMENKGYHICSHTYDHSRWYESTEAGPEFTIAECEEDLLKAIRVLNTNGFIDAADFLVFPGSSGTKPGLAQIAKKWTEAACTILSGNNTLDDSISCNLHRCAINYITNPNVEYYAQQLSDLEKENENNWIIYYSHCKNNGDGEEWNQALFEAVIGNSIDNGYVPMTLNEAWKYRKSMYAIQEAYGY